MSFAPVAPVVGDFIQIRDNESNIANTARALLFKVDRVERYRDFEWFTDGTVIEDPNGWNLSTVGHVYRPLSGDKIVPDNEVALRKLPFIEDAELPSIKEV
jgi:hypothetical protein